MYPSLSHLGTFSINNRLCPSFVSLKWPRRDRTFSIFFFFVPCPTKGHFQVTFDNVLRLFCVPHFVPKDPAFDVSFFGFVLKNIFIRDIFDSVPQFVPYCPSQCPSVLGLILYNFFVPPQNYPLFLIHRRIVY